MIIGTSAAIAVTGIVALFVFIHNRMEARRRAEQAKLDQKIDRMIKHGSY